MGGFLYNLLKKKIITDESQQDSIHAKHQSGYFTPNLLNGGFKKKFFIHSSDDHNRTSFRRLAFKVRHVLVELTVMEG